MNFYSLKKYIKDNKFDIFIFIIFIVIITFCDYINSKEKLILFIIIFLFLIFTRIALKKLKNDILYINYLELKNKIENIVFKFSKNDFNEISDNFYKSKNIKKLQLKISINYFEIISINNDIINEKLNRKIDIDEYYHYILTIEIINNKKPFEYSKEELKDVYLSYYNYINTDIINLLNEKYSENKIFEKYFIKN